MNRTLPPALPGCRALGLVVAGGAVGTAARVGLSALLQPVSGTWPWATLTANLVGCLALGYLMGRLARRVAPKPGLALALGTGLLGGFTTYSAFAVETVQLAQGAHLALAVGYAAASVLGGVAAAGLGLTLGQRR